MKRLKRLTLLLTFGTAGLTLAAVAAAQNNQDAPPAREQVALTTRDGVQLRADFYPGAKKKESIPVILVHMYQGSRQDFQTLAEFLQLQGHAVLAPDLRGHGESTQVVGASRELDAGRLRPADMAAMAAIDLEACKKFLIEKNNAGELNIDQLAVVGAEMGASVALLWAAIDWSWPPLATGKQGQDVKAVVLISPEYVFKGLKINDALMHPAVRSVLSVLIAIGRNDAGAEREARRIHTQFERGRPELDPADRDKKDLFLVGIDTRLQGTRILEEPNLGLHRQIAQFIKLRIEDRAADFPWKERISPFSQ
jgi:alpha-beta hydrolase superfamily lysophospholipase